MTPAMTKIEQVARAIEDNIKAGLPDGVAIDYQYAASAAIEAMREPTIAMRHASSFQAAEVDWPAMIDASLQEQEQG